MIDEQTGFGQLGLKAIKLFMDGQSYGAQGMAKLLLGDEHERSALHRIDHAVPENTYKMDDARVIRELKGMGHFVGRDRGPVLEPIFFDEPAEDFVPYYRLDEG